MSNKQEETREQATGDEYTNTQEQDPQASGTDQEDVLPVTENSQGDNIGSGSHMELDAFPTDKPEDPTTNAMDVESVRQGANEIPQVNLATEDVDNLALLPDHSESTTNTDQGPQQDDPNSDAAKNSLGPELGELPEQNQDNQEQDMTQDEDNHDVINTSTLQPPHAGHQFTTPLKSLPPLKDIDPISTPKAFSVAKDNDVDTPNESSSPLITRHVQDLHNAGNDLNQNFETNDNFSKESVVSSFLGISSLDLKSVNEELINKLHERSMEFQELKSDNQLLKINQEQTMLIQTKKLKLMSGKIEKLDKQNIELRQERDSLYNEKETNMKAINELEETKTIIENKLGKIENESKKYESNYTTQISDKDQEILKLNNSLNKLTKTNIEQSQRINQIIKDLNDARNDKFNLKLENNKISNEVAYIKNQRIWYEEELKSVQEKFTDLIKKHESEFLLRSNKLASMASKNESLERLNKSQKDTINRLQESLEKEISKSTSLDSKYEIENYKLNKELKNKEELLELTQVQSLQRNERIEQLESYIEEIKTKFGESIKKLESSITNKNEAIVVLEEKLKRAEEVLDEELHKETDLPKLSASAEIIASTKSEGISLSSLYSEYNHLKKQLVLERSQKERLANQLESFVAELESKKPTIANYTDQIKFYENSLQEMIGKVEAIRLEKLDGEKEYNKLKVRISEYNNDLVSMKKLCKDLGKQLCYYLIHSKIRDSNEDPLTLTERKAIENILERSGNNDGILESDTDQLISERLVGFTNIIELQQQNEDLLKVVRQLGKKLENQDDNFNGSIESVAIDEAKEAILTLESELSSVNIKLEAANKERDILKSLADSTSVNGSKSEYKFLSDANEDLKLKLKDSEKALKDLQFQSNATIEDFNEKLRELTNTKNELSMKITSLKHSNELAGTRLSNALTSLDNAREEVKQFKNDVEFWKNQSTKQESLLIKKSNELKDAENIINKERITVNKLNTEREILKSHEHTMLDEIAQIKSDKSHLNEFVMNLQSLLKERESSSKELSSRLSQSIENYQKLQSRLAENDERMVILSSQSELALKAQNAKLEQVNELSQLLLDYKNKLAQKNSTVDILTQKVQELEKRTITSNTLEGFRRPSSDQHGNELNQNYQEELESLRRELQIAESQVAEFSGLAKAAETALINSTNTFESYKRESEEKLRVLSQEKDSLESELKELSNLLSKSKKDYNDAEKQYFTKVEELKFALEESRTKASAYDELQRDYETKFDTLTKDLDNQTKISSENQNKYHNEIQRNEKLSEDLDQMKDKCGLLESDINELNSKLVSTKLLLDRKDELLENQKQNIEDKLMSSQMRVKDLQDQNNLLLNQLELSKLSGPTEISESSSIDDLKEVISYLRREKDSAEARLASSSDDQQRLEQRFKQVSSELEASKSELIRMTSSTSLISHDNKEHERLLEQLQQLNILRESNTTLRNENNHNIQRISYLENELQSMTSKLEPLEKKIEDLSIQNDLKDQTIRLVQEENQKSKVQANVDNHEHAESELEDIKAMKQRFANLKNEFQSKLLMHRNKAKDLEKTVEILKSDLSNVNKQLEEATENYKRELSTTSEILKKDSDSNEKLSRTLAELDDTRKSIESLKKESEDKINSIYSEKLSLETQIQSLISKVQNLESDNPNQESFEKRLDEIRAQFENEKSEWKKNIEKEIEAKLKQEMSNIDSNTSGGNRENEVDIRNEIEKEFKEKYSSLEKDIQQRESTLEQEMKENFEKELKAKVEEEVAKRIASTGNNQDIDQVRDQLLKEHKQEIEKLKQEFASQISKEKDDIRNVTEKKFEIKLRMLNKKLDKLEGKNSSKTLGPSGTVPEQNSNSTSVSSLPVTPVISQDSKPSMSTELNIDPSKLPLGHQFTESTLTVHRPTIDRSNLSTKTIQNQKPNIEKVGQKRPMVTKNQSANKKPKE